MQITCLLQFICQIDRGFELAKSLNLSPNGAVSQIEAEQDEDGVDNANLRLSTYNGDLRASSYSNSKRELQWIRPDESSW